MNKIYLTDLQLKTFTEQDALDYCQLNNININLVEELYLNYNKLTDISGIKLFKNLEILHIGDNKIEDISVIQYLTEIKYLNISNLVLKSDQIEYIKSLKKLKKLSCYNGFKKKSILKQLNKRVHIYE